MGLLPAQADGSGSTRPALANGLAASPPMGWNSWNTFSTSTTLADVKDTIDFMHDHKVGGKTMLDLGYNTVTIDDGWATKQRKRPDGTLDPAVASGNNGVDTNPDATLVPDSTKFPEHASLSDSSVTVNGMEYLAQYAHSKGMKLGLYSSPTYLTCQGQPGSLGHEVVDAAQFVAWGVDYVKYDSCAQGWNGSTYSQTSQGKKAWGLGGWVLYGNSWKWSEEQSESMYARSQRFQQALDQAVVNWNSAHTSPRAKVVFSISGQPVHNGDSADQKADDPAAGLPYTPNGDNPNYGTNSEWDQGAPGNAPYGRWCGYVANLCRIGGDRGADGFDAVYSQMDTALKYPAFGNTSSTGHWNDLDMMFTGWRAAGASANFGRTQAVSEMSILSMMSSPLISGADLRSTAWSGRGIQDADLAVYLNGDAVAVNQDAGGMASRVKDVTDADGNRFVVLKRTMANGDTVVLFVNEGSKWGHVQVTPSELGLTGTGTYTFKDLWANTNGTTLTNTDASTGTFSTETPLGSGNQYWVPAQGVAMYRIAHS